MSSSVLGKFSKPTAEAMFSTKPDKRCHTNRDASKHFLSYVYMNNQAFHGVCSTPPNKLHITILELEAVDLTVNVFLKELIWKFYWSDPNIQR